jgi:uncharacterized protein (DUF2147 family)
MKKSVLSAVVLSSLLLCAQAQAQLSPLGVWTPIDEASGKPSAEIVISTNAAGTLSGVIQKTLIFAPGASAACDKCTDDRKGKPTQGMEIIRGGKKLDGKDVWEGGKILDPNEGKEFSVRFTPIDGGKKMEVRGYIGSPMLGKTQTWVRVDR